jgi:large subunit ribosomal protein L29
MKARELRAMTDEQLRDAYEDLKQELYTLRINKATGELKDTSMVKKTRHDLARVLTILRERELAAQAAAKDSK